MGKRPKRNTNNQGLRSNEKGCVRADRFDVLFFLKLLRQLTNLELPS